jgi:hypothetical protein
LTNRSDSCLEILGDMKKTKGKKEEFIEKNVIEKQAVFLAKCSFSWEKLIEMKDKNVEFFAGDGYKRLRIIDIDEKTKSIHMICELGKISWPLKFKKLEEIHKKIHGGEVTLIPYKIDKLIPTWGNFVTGIFKYFGCDKTE